MKETTDRRKKYTYWQFTDFNSLELLELPPGTKYACGQVEVCPKTGRKHLQGFVRLSAARALSYVRKLRKAHWTPVTATPLKARNYCKKSETSVEGTFVEFGKPPKSGQGKRTDIDDAKTAIFSGISKRDFIEKYWNIFAKYPRLYDSTQLVLKPPDGKPGEISVILFIGPPGTGKTRTAKTWYPSHYEIPYSGSKGIWFDGYDKQDCLLLDDFVGGLERRALLKLLDIYTRQWPVKGSFVWVRPKVVVVTSNVKPKDWYKPMKGWDDFDQALFRRFTKVVLFTKQGQKKLNDPFVDYFKMEAFEPKVTGFGLDLISKGY